MDRLAERWDPVFRVISFVPSVLALQFLEAICRSALWKSALKNVNNNGLKSAELTFRNKNITLIHCGILVISEFSRSINRVRKKYGNHAQAKQTNITK